MSRFSLVLVGLMLLGLPAEAQQGQRDFPAIVPHDWTVLASRKPNEWRAVSPRKDAWLSLYATPATGSIAAHLDRWGTGAGDRVTYRRQGNGWTAISGFTANGRIFYRETALACGGRMWHDLAFEYPRSDKLAMDEFVTRASHALGAYSKAGC